MSHFFLFYKKMIRVLYAMFVLAMKDLEAYLDNSNLFLRQSAIWFELSTPKKKNSKQSASILYYQY